MGKSKSDRQRDSRTAVYPGSFDPITNGHLDMIDRARRLYSEVLVAVGENPDKPSLFPMPERVELVREAVRHFGNVTVETFRGLFVKFLRERKLRVVLRGVRNSSDFEYELQMSFANRAQHPELETVFLPASAEWAFLSSRLVREIASLGGDVSRFVPPAVQKAIRRRYPRPARQRHGGAR